MCLDEAVIELEALGAGLRTLTREHSLIFLWKVKESWDSSLRIIYQNPLASFVVVVFQVVWKSEIGLHHSKVTCPSFQSLGWRRHSQLKDSTSELWLFLFLLLFPTLAPPSASHTSNYVASSHQPALTGCYMPGLWWSDPGAWKCQLFGPERSLVSTSQVCEIWWPCIDLVAFVSCLH